MKMPNGYGNISKLSGSRRNPWRVRKTTGWELDEAKGKTIQKFITIGYYPTKAEALQALAAYNSDPYDLHLNTITFEEVYDRWSAVHFPKISHSNATGYKAAYKLCQGICKMKFNDIKLDHLQKVVDESGKNEPTLKKFKNLLGLMYDYAVMHEITTPDRKELIKYVDISKAGNPNAIDRRPFKKSEIKRLWASKDSNVYMTVVLILIYTGVRISELLDLKKEDVHLEEKWFYVRESKTKSGIREVPIAEKIVPFFEYWMNKDSEYLVCTPEGKHFDYRNYYDSYWKPMMAAINAEDLTPHCTRHTCISLLTEVGIDQRIIRKIVGHKGQGVTETVYTHLELPIKLEAINKI